MAGCASLTLAFTAWGLAGVQLWSLHTMLAGGCLTLLCALCPLPARIDGVPRFQNIFRLLRAPVFWLGLLFLLYLLIAALNPGMVIVRDERGWWVEAVEAPLGTQLPVSVASEYSRMNAWRVFVLFLASFSLVWGVWAGLRRRQAALGVVWCFVLSGAAMALVAILQKYTGAEEVLWTFPSSNPHFWGSFFYRNQGAAFLNWVLVATGVLYLFHARRARLRLKFEGPHFLCFLLFLLVALSVSMSLSRGGILVGAALGICFLIFVACDAAATLFHGRISVWVLVIGVVLFGGGGYFAAKQIDWSALEKRFGDFEETMATADTNERIVMSRATWAMAQDRLWLGWGPGSFRYVFPMYQRNYPELFREFYWYGPNRPMRAFYRYAHNDILQFVAEYGLVGVGLLAAALGSMLLALLRQIGRLPLCAFFLCAGIALACAHAFIDFIFNSPAYWVAFSGGLAAMCRLCSLEGERS